MWNGFGKIKSTSTRYFVVAYGIPPFYGSPMSFDQSQFGDVQIVMGFLIELIKLGIFFI